MKNTQEILRESLEFYKPGSIMPECAVSLHIDVAHVQKGIVYSYEPTLKHKTIYRLEFNEAFNNQVMPTLIHRERTSFPLQWIKLVEGMEFDDGECIEKAVVFDVLQPPAKGIFSIIASRDDVIQAIDKGTTKIV